MKTRTHFIFITSDLVPRSRVGPETGRPGGRRPAHARGSSVLIIVVLLACMAVIIVANATALALLKSQLQLIDQQQRQKYGQSPGH